MNKYIRAMFVAPCSLIKIAWTKFFHPKAFHCSVVSMVSPFSEITINYGGKLSVGRGFKMRDGAKLRVRKNGKCSIANNVAIGSNCVIVCYDKITIGAKTQLAPNVQIYDHDHDFRAKGGLAAMKFKTSSVEIGSNVWIGANAVILRGTKIGDNCVVAAGSVLKGEYPANSVIVQKHETTMIQY